MRAFVDLLAALDPDESDVEGIAEHDREAIDRDLAAPPVLESRSLHLRLEGVQVVASCRVKLEGPAHHRTLHRIDGLGLAGPAVQIAEGRRQRQDALLQAPIDALQGFLAEVPDVVGGHDRLNVGGEPAAAGREIQPFVREVELDHALLHEFLKVDPIAPIADTAIDLVDHDTGGSALLHETKHLRPDRPAGLGRRLALLEPPGDRYSALCREALNRGALLLEGDTLA